MALINQYQKVTLQALEWIQNRVVNYENFMVFHPSSLCPKTVSLNRVEFLAVKPGISNVHVIASFAKTFWRRAYQKAALYIPCVLRSFKIVLLNFVTYYSLSFSKSLTTCALLIPNFRILDSKVALFISSISAAPPTPLTFPLVNFSVFMIRSISPWR